MRRLADDRLVRDGQMIGDGLADYSRTDIGLAD